MAYADLLENIIPRYLSEVLFHLLILIEVPEMGVLDARTDKCEDTLG